MHRNRGRFPWLSYCTGLAFLVRLEHTSIVSGFSVRSAEYYFIEAVAGSELKGNHLLSTWLPTASHTESECTLELYPKVRNSSTISRHRSWNSWDLWDGQDMPFLAKEHVDIPTKDVRMTCPCERHLLILIRLYRFSHGLSMTWIMSGTDRSISMERIRRNRYLHNKHSHWYESLSLGFELWVFKRAIVSA